MDMSDTKYFLGVVFALLVATGVIFFVVRRFLQARADRQVRRDTSTGGTGGKYTPPPRNPPDAKP